MTTWGYTTKARVETALARETDDNILLENGGLLLVEDIHPTWGIDSKNTTTWGQDSKNTTTWGYQAKS